MTKTQRVLTCDNLQISPHSKSSQQKNAEQKKKIPHGAYKILLNFTLKPHILNIETIRLF